LPFEANLAFAKLRLWQSMGVVRVILAMAVLISHVGIPRILPDGDMAVKLFF
jgi:hypothetical protein